MRNIFFHIAAACLLAAPIAACDDYLDEEPQSQVFPDKYFTDATQLQAYADGLYATVIPTSNKGYFDTDDKLTDNQVGQVADRLFVDGDYKVPYSGGSWTFETIYRINFFLSQVEPRFGDDLSGSKSTISGDLQRVRHYIGEMYCMRAMEYFRRYQAMGDFPIITEPLSDSEAALVEASRRMPRTTVARFILSDLDRAATLMDGCDLATTRINRDLALLLRSRVALFEGTWLKYFRGTPFVPNGEGWPGKTKDYNAGFEFAAGSIDAEISYFLTEAMASAKAVAEKYKGSLTANTGTVPQSLADDTNPYLDMFASTDLSQCKEVLLWRQFAYGVTTHGCCVGANEGNWAVGVTRGCVQNFLMADGTPVYAHGSYADGDGYYLGDKTIADVRANRDSRLTIFLKQPGQVNILKDGVAQLSDLWRTEPVPKIVHGSEQLRATTGYLLRKGQSTDVKDYQDVWAGFTGLVLYRSVEALLNYMEACCELNGGQLDATARDYWQTIRRRARVSDDIDATIAATDLTREAENDWGAYSAGQLLPNTAEGRTLYSIRRERRCELLSEGLRYMDLRRWRAMDQMTAQPYIPEGIHLWGTPQEQEQRESIGADFEAKVSPEADVYLRPYRVKAGLKAADGYTWHMAHYLEPVCAKQFLVTSADGESVETSPIYQNPYWQTSADTPAQK